MESRYDPKLSELLKEWQVPGAPPSLDARVLAGRGRMPKSAQDERREALVNCTWCGEPVEPHEQHPAFQNQPVHFACGFRSVAGSVAHIARRCSCFIPGSTEADPPGVTRRRAAQMALEVYELVVVPRMIN